LLVGFRGVLDGQRVQTKLRLNRLQKARSRLMQADPDDMTRLL
jgi:hypothetical protein